jgi:hypothetical protein
MPDNATDSTTTGTGYIGIRCSPAETSISNNALPSQNEEPTEPTVASTIIDIKNIIEVIEETLQAPKALPNRKGALRDYVAQLREAAVRLGVIIEGKE